jgi:hypothetical protein
LIAEKSAALAMSIDMNLKTDNEAGKNKYIRLLTTV